MTEADLHREYARVIDMCAGTGVKPWECVRIFQGGYFRGHPTFEVSPEVYTFALALVEGRPVFAGDKIYWQGRPYVAKSHAAGHPERIIAANGGHMILSEVSWNPPKPKTFPLNGVELPLPDKGDGDDIYGFTLHGKHFGWNKSDDYVKVAKALSLLLSGDAE